MEAYSTDIREQRDQLEDLWRSTEYELRTRHDTEIVTEVRKISVKIESGKTLLYNEQPDLCKLIIVKAPHLSGTFCESCYHKSCCISKEKCVR